MVTMFAYFVIDYYLNQVNCSANDKHLSSISYTQQVFTAIVCMSHVCVPDINMLHHVQVLLLYTITIILVTVFSCLAQG